MGSLYVPFVFLRIRTLEFSPAFLAFYIRAGQTMAIWAPCHPWHRAIPPIPGHKKGQTPGEDVCPKVCLPN